jgi:GTP-binding protein
VTFVKRVSGRCKPPEVDHSWAYAPRSPSLGITVTVPVVAIVGRPNVGKSSLFNWLAGRRIAIVDPTAGVTRDRISTLVPIDSHYVELVDTGGIGIADVDNLTEQIERQIATALDQAHVILFVVDGRAGIMRLDEEVAERLRHIHKPVLCVANKCDTEAIDPQAAEFYKLGFGKVVCVSAQQNRNRAELLHLIQERTEAAVSGTDATLVMPPPVLKLAIVGRRNTGKSTFINSLAQSERVIVSETPGTTRDSIDVRFERDGLTFLAIDTAGVRKKKSLQNDIEFYSLARAERSIRRADVVLLFLDATQRISKVDKQLAEYILEQHKPAVFVVNKWDLMTPMPTSKMGHYIRATFPSLDFMPIAFVTAKSGKNVYAVLNLAQHLHKQAGARVGTGDLNRVLRQALEASPPPLRQNRRPKLYYATQAGANPPTIVLFTNGPELFDNTYQRYLLKTIRDRLHFNDVPIRLYLRRRQRTDPASLEETTMPSAEKSDRAAKRQKSELWKDI